MTTRFLRMSFVRVEMPSFSSPRGDSVERNQKLVHEGSALPTHRKSSSFSNQRCDGWSAGAMERTGRRRRGIHALSSFVGGPDVSCDLCRDPSRVGVKVLCLSGIGIERVGVSSSWAGCQSFTLEYKGQAAEDEVVPVVLVPEMVGGQPPNRRGDKSTPIFLFT